MQPKAGVFVGWVSARVRDLLWQKTAKSAAKGSGILIYSDNTEQGFSARSFGDSSRSIRDFEGLFLARTPKKA
jgi:CRISPR-associated protein Cas2